MSFAGTKNVKLWDLNKDGYLVKKLDKNKKQMVNDLHSDIQSHFGEVDFKSKLEQSKNDDQIVSNLNDVFKSKNIDNKIYEDINTANEWVNIMNTFAKLKNTFGSNWGEALRNYVKYIQDYQKKVSTSQIKNVGQEVKENKQEKIEEKK